MFDVTATLILMTFAGAIFYLLGRADGLNVGRVKTNELVRDAARTLETAHNMLAQRALDDNGTRAYLRRNIRRLQDGERLE